MFPSVSRLVTAVVETMASWHQHSDTLSEHTFSLVFIPRGAGILSLADLCTRHPESCLLSAVPVYPHCLGILPRPPTYLTPLSCTRRTAGSSSLLCTHSLTSSLIHSCLFIYMWRKKVEEGVATFVPLADTCLRAYLLIQAPHSFIYFGRKGGNRVSFADTCLQSVHLFVGSPTHPLLSSFFFILCLKI